MSKDTYQEVVETAAGDLPVHLQMYLESGGSRGHIIDMSSVGGRSFTTTLLLKTIGRKSGEERIVPLVYGILGGEVVIVASKAGADSHPAWYLNLVGSKEVSFQIATQAFRGTWREPQDAEREQVWDFMVGISPTYENYRASTGRRIPLVMLTALEPVDAFR